VQPYFPGYLFTHVDLELIGSSILKWMPGGTGLVLFGDEPAVIPDSLIYAIKQRVDSLTKSSDKNPVLWRKGDNIAIHEGILTGYEGIFDVQLSGTDRVRILLSLLGNRFLPVEISASCIQRIDQNEFVWDR
jgi:transcriptional antiterminator RfaH